MTLFYCNTISIRRSSNAISDWIIFPCTSRTSI